jgi:hypothetical protein
MKIILDIKENRVPFFVELLKSLDYIKVISEIRDKKGESLIEDLSEAFDNVKQHSRGKKKLKSAKDLLNEL